MLFLLRSLRNLSQRQSTKLLLLKSGNCLWKNCGCLTSDIHTNSVQRTLWESDKRQGYKSEEPQQSFWESVKDGFGELKHEIRLFLKETREKWESDPVLVFRRNETDVVFTFKTPESLDKWMVGADSDHKEGRSTASLTLSPSGHGLFSGYVNSQHFQDGKVKRTGYASIRTLRVRVKNI